MFNAESFITAGSKEKVEFCKELGASEGAIRGENMFGEVRSWTSDGFDIILDPVGANYLENNLKVLGLDGKLIILG